MADPPLLEIDYKIRTLSALITKLNQKVEAPDFTDHGHISPTLAACNHFATLLTRGIEHVDKRNRGPTRKVVAVTGKLSSDLTLAVSVDAHEVLLKRDVFTQNPSTRDQPTFRIDRIVPSPRTLNDLAAPPHRVNEDSLQDYAGHLLAAVRDLRTTQNHGLFNAFIVRSCLPKITHRLHADLYIFNQPLEQILNGWKPQPGELLAPKQVRVSLDPDSRLALASIVVAGQEHAYEWNINTAPIWISTLCRLIKDAKGFAGDCRDRNDQDNKSIDSGALVRLSFTLQTLFGLLYKLPIRDLLSLLSIQVKLRGELKDNRSAVSDEDGPDMAIEPNEEIHLLALRYLRNTVACQSAMQYVSTSIRKSRVSRNIVLDFVVTPIASPDVCAPAQPIVDSAIEYAVEKLRLDPKAENVLLMIQAMKDTLLPVQFRGTVHCEASLMGMAIACKGGVPLPGDVTQWKLRVIKKLVTEAGVSTIGVGKKCCWCCSLLAKRLQVEHHDVSFDIPASHGLIFPWALPTIGISTRVAESMEAALMDVWLREVVKFARDYTKPAISTAESAMSSPPGSTPGDSNGEDNLVGEIVDLLKTWNV